MAWVHETTVQGHKVAWKKMHIRTRSRRGVKEMKEVEVLKKLSHVHMVVLVGTFTHERVLGLLLHPVAVCDLQSFFEDAQAYLSNSAEDSQMLRLNALEYVTKQELGLAWPIYSQLGCLVSAVAYLHSQSIRHKDLKPSNVLLSKNRLYISDFGHATDFSLLTQSATEGGGGTPRYLSPEVCTSSSLLIVITTESFTGRSEKSRRACSGYLLTRLYIP